MDPDQARQNVGPDLDPSCLTLTVFLKQFFKNIEQTTKIHIKLSSMRRVQGSLLCDIWQFPYHTFYQPETPISA